MTMRRKQSAGFSVIELMIALGLGLLVVAGIIQLFVGNSRTYEIVEAQSRLQENARFAFDFITESARSAGYFGCAPNPANIALKLNGPWNIVPEFNMTEPVRGWESQGDGTFTPDDLVFLPKTSGGTDTYVHTAVAGNEGIDRTELAATSDLLVFRSVEQPMARLDQVTQPTADPRVSTPGGDPAFAVNDIVIISDCEQAAVFSVTGTTSLSGGDVTQLASAVGTASPYDNGPDVTTPTGDLVPPTLSIVGRSYGEDATVGRIISTFFFVAESSENDNLGNTVNALWMKAGVDAPVELVQGIEDMQILFGLDTTNDNVANVNRYVPADQVGDPTQIVAARVTLIVSSVDTLVENQNQRLQRTFTKTIQLRNMRV